MGKSKTMEEFFSITRRLRELRLEEAPQNKLGWYKRYIPIESMDGYNDYRLALKQSLMVEEKKENEVKVIKEEIVTVDNDQDVDLGGLFN